MWYSPQGPTSAFGYQGVRFTLSSRADVRLHSRPRIVSSRRTRDSVVPGATRAPLADTTLLPTIFSAGAYLLLKVGVSRMGERGVGTVEGGTEKGPTEAVLPLGKHIYREGRFTLRIYLQHPHRGCFTPRTTYKRIYKWGYYLQMIQMGSILPLTLPPPFEKFMG